MSLDWNICEQTHPFDAEVPTAVGYRFHHAESNAADDPAIKQDLEASLEKAVSLLDRNVKNESLFFMAEWNPAGGVLRLSVTDGQKANDAEEIVCTRFNSLVGGEAGGELTEKVSFWVKDFLSICESFMNFSLVALFTDTSRERVQIL